MEHRAASRYASDVLRRHGRTLATVVFGESGENVRLEARILQRKRRRLVLAIRAAGKTVVFKQFDLDAPTDLVGYMRERDSLRILGESGLVPPMTHFDDQNRFIVMKYIAGESTKELISPDNVEAVCQDIGQWLAAYYEVAPKVAKSGTWSEYLRQGQSVSPKAIGADQDDVAGFPLDYLSLSRDDGNLSNMIRQGGGGFVGLDFERAEWKPYGWDLLRSARTVASLLPEQSETAISALARGFSRGRPALARQWAALARIFVAAFAGPSGLSSSEDEPVRREHSDLELR